MNVILTKLQFDTIVKLLTKEGTAFCQGLKHNLLEQKSQQFDVAGVAFKGNKEDVEREYYEYSNGKPFDFNDFVSWVNDTQEML